MISTSIMKAHLYVIESNFVCEIIKYFLFLSFF